MAEVSQDHAGQWGHSPLTNFLRKIAVVCAGAGGLAIFSAALLVTYSVLMRTLGFSGVRGDFEAVELVCTACASLFLPLCQANRGHVMVDLFTNWMPERGKKRLDGVWMLIFAAAWGVLSWRLVHGLLDLQYYGDKTMLLRASIWWVYVPAVLGTGLSAIIALIQALPMLSGHFRALEGR